MANPSTVWAQLSIPNPANGSIPYVNTDGITIVTDVAYFNYNGLLHQLTLTNQLVLGYSALTTAGVSGTLATPAGRFIISAGQNTFTLTNSLITTQSVVSVNLETTDATATYVKTVKPSLGQVVVTLNANCTGAVTISYTITC